VVLVRYLETLRSRLGQVSGAARRLAGSLPRPDQADQRVHRGLPRPHGGL
jgi:hypothetical protein